MCSCLTLRGSFGCHCCAVQLVHVYRTQPCLQTRRVVVVSLLPVCSRRCVCAAAGLIAGTTELCGGWRFCPRLMALLLRPASLAALPASCGPFSLKS